MNPSIRDQGVLVPPGALRRSLAVVAAVGVSLAACGAGPSDPASWLSEDYRATLPSDPAEAFVTHTRYAVQQEFGPDTYVEEATDDELLGLAALWCETDPTRFSTVVGDELASRGVELNPGRSFLPRPPIDQILTRVADRHQPDLCVALTPTGTDA